MARNPQLANLAANAEADAVAALLDGGFLRIYSGSQPITGDTPIGAQMLLAELQFGTPAFTAAVNGVATATAITGETSAPGTGTATWFRCLRANGTTRVCDGSVGVADADLILSTTLIQAGAEVTVSTYTLTAPK